MINFINSNLETTGYIITAAFILLLAIVNLRTLKFPNKLIYTFLTVGVVYRLAEVYHSKSIIPLIEGILLLVAVIFILTIFKSYKGIIGYGDIKLLGGVALFLGLKPVVVSILILANIVLLGEISYKYIYKRRLQIPSGFMWLAGILLSRFVQISPFFVIEACIIFFLIRGVDKRDWSELSALCKSGKYEEALDYVDKLLKTMQKNSKLYNDKGYILINLGRYEEALEYFDKSIILGQKDEAPFNNKSLALYNLGRYEEALEYANRSLAIKSMDPWALTNKGNAELNLGMYHEAYKSYEKALDIAPKMHQIHWGMGLALFEIKDYERAAQAFKTYTILKYPDPDALYKIGLCYYNLGENKEALEVLDRAVVTAPDRPDLHTLRGNVLLEEKSYYEANRCFETSIRLYPDYSWARYCLSRAQTVLGKDEEALENLKISIEQNDKLRAMAVEDDFFDRLKDTLKFRHIVYLNI